MFPFTISKDFGLDLAKGQSVFVQSHLSETAHAQKYALKALPSDAASRLAVSISGQDSKGEFYAYLVNKSRRKIAMKMNNTLVDILEGKRSKRPRWWLKTMVEGKSKDMYT
jgi:Mg/Co/Ni transporter MgtE